MSELREDIERSFAAAESEQENGATGTLQTDSAQTTEQREPTAPATAEPAAPAADAGEPAAGAAPAKQAAESVKPASLTDTPPVTTQRAAAIKAPAAWKPEVREHWEKLPAPVQQEVQRREREVAMALQETAQIRDFAQEFHRMAAPYQHIIALEGDDPLTSFGHYLRTASLLRVGSPAEKANAVAQAVRQYGIDVNLLDSALANVLQGQPLPAAQPQQGPVLDPRVDQLLATIQQQQQASEAAMVQSLASELETFAADPKHEFYDDVKVDMGEILALATSRGRRMSLDEAYDRAIKLHPEISKVVAQREAAEKARAAQEAALKRRKAGSSVTSAAPQQGVTQENANASRRSDIEAAIQALEG